MTEETKPYQTDNNRGALFNTEKAGWDGHITIEGEKLNAYIVAIRPFAENPNPSAPTHKLFLHSREKGVSHATAIPLFRPRNQEKAVANGKIAEGSTETHWVHVFLSESARGTKFVAIKLHLKEEEQQPQEGESSDAPRKKLPF
jgi:hypothetical protein